MTSIDVLDVSKIGGGGGEGLVHQKTKCKPRKYKTVLEVYKTEKTMLKRGVELFCVD
jgi:hypothetical protein